MCEMLTSSVGERWCGVIQRTEKCMSHIVDEEAEGRPGYDSTYCEETAHLG
jgi:hypothetical protein